MKWFNDLSADIIACAVQSNVNYTADENFGCFLIFKGDLVCFMMFPHTVWLGLLFNVIF